MSNGLTFDVFLKTLEKRKKKEEEIKRLEEKYKNRVKLIKVNIEKNYNR